MSQTSYCYHCGIHHPVEEMRQIMTKGGKRSDVSMTNELLQYDGRYHLALS